MNSLHPDLYAAGVPLVPRLPLLSRSQASIRAIFQPNYREALYGAAQ